MPKFRYGSRAVGRILRDLGVEGLPRYDRKGREQSQLEREFIRLARANKRKGMGNTTKPRPKRTFLWEQQKGFCACCERHTPFVFATLEHLKPRAHGGSNHLGNLKMTCRGCNFRRGTGDFYEFKTYALAMVKRGDIWPLEGNGRP